MRRRMVCKASLQGVRALYARGVSVRGPVCYGSVGEESEVESVEEGRKRSEEARRLLPGEAMGGGL